MRPDLEDFEELSEGEAPRSRAMSWLVLVVAVGGFAALAYYAYHSGSRSMQDGQVLVVQADPAAIKEAPADPQGESFPNQDKTIYDAIAPNAKNKVEKLLPEAEEPVIPEPAVAKRPTETPKPAATTTFVNKETAVKEAVDPVDEQLSKRPAPAIAPESKPEPVKTAEVKAPAFVNVKPATTPAPAPKPAAPAVKPAPAPKPAAATGNYKVQLGAFKSDAEARTQWGKIVAKHGDVVKGSPVVVRADLPNGTFYRLRASGYASADAAKAACAKLSSRGQGCFYAGQ